MRTPTRIATLTLVTALAACSDPASTPGDTAGEAGSGDTTEVDDTAEVDAGSGEGSDGSGDVGPDAPPERPTVNQCFADILATAPDGSYDGPDYDQFEPVVGYHCLGTDHQDITGIQKVVFLGDSITVGTPPTYPEDYYRNVLTAALTERFGELVVDAEHAKFGARNDDLLREPHQQILMAFPEVEPLRTLVVITMGGNDVFAWAEAHAEGKTDEEIMAMVQEAVTDFDDAMRWFRQNPERFPNGVFVVFSNIYEYTDGTGDTTVCPLAATLGLTEPWPGGRAPVIWANEQYMRIAVEYGFDMIFLLENFCGHGLLYDDPSTQCYRGPDTEPWIDATCIHPNPAGHAEIARMVTAVVDE